MKDVIEHYNKLIDENNDPARDPQPLKDYMDKWDGQKFIESMQLDKRKFVLEIGVGTGRLAMKVAPNCKSLCGIDISEKTIQRATENLSIYPLPFTIVFPYYCIITHIIYYIKEDLCERKQLLLTMIYL